MPLFDAVNHSMCALAPGGFSTQPASLGAYHSFPIEALTWVLMLLGCTGFAVHYLFLTGKWRALLRHPEPRTLFVSLLLGLPLLAWSLHAASRLALSASWRLATFNGISALTGTGYSTTDFSNWSDFSLVALSVLMTIGGGVGSTAGGLKLYRVYLFTKSLYWELKAKLLPPRAVFRPYLWRQGRKFFITPDHQSQMFLFVLVYLFAWLGGSLILMAYGHSAAASIFEYASALGTVGLSLGITSPAAPAGLLWVEIAGMFLGRLEFLVVFVAAGRLFRDMRLLMHERRNVPLPPVED